MLAGMKPETPRPTLEQLRRGTPWCWAASQAGGIRPVYHPLGTGRLERHAATIRALQQVRTQGGGFAAPKLGGQPYRLGALSGE